MMSVPYVLLGTAGFFIWRGLRRSESTADQLLGDGP
jgi:hypothetical protein